MSMQLPPGVQQQMQVQQMLVNLRITTASQLMCARLAGQQNYRDMSESEEFYKPDDESENTLVKAREAAAQAVLYTDCLLEALGLARVTTKADKNGDE